jgi:HEAT repeat protein
MKKRLPIVQLAVGGLGLVILGAAMWSGAGLRNASGEHTFDGKPSSRWRADLRAELTDSNKQAQPVSHALQQGSAAEAVPVLIDLLDDEDVKVRIVAASFLREHFTRKPGPEASAAVDPLIVCLRDEHPMVRRRSVQALGYLGPRASAAVPGLAALLKDQDEAVAVEATFALARMGSDAEAALPALQDACQDPRPVVQKGAALAVKAIAPGK